MSIYTTGEIAKLCGVTVRTVQYYDSRSILVPSALSEGGRRLYSEEDLKRLRMICFLREAGLSINSISELLQEEHSGSTLSLLLEQQILAAREALNQQQARLNMLEALRRGISLTGQFSPESIGDIACQMKSEKKLTSLRGVLIAVGIVMDIIQIATAVLWWKTGIFWPFLLGMAVVIALGLWVTRFYARRVSYICPACHGIFRPRFRQMFALYHTTQTRRLPCPHCGRKGYCVEVARQPEN